MRDKLWPSGHAGRPGLDDKVLADWNGLMIAALVRAALALDRPEWVALASSAFAFIAATMAATAASGTPGARGSWFFRGSRSTTPR